MANIHQLALHHATQSSAVVWVRSTTSGALTVQCNGQLFSGDAVDTAVGDGTGVCTVTGLAPGQSYPFEAFISGVSVGSGTLKTMPADGGTWALGFGTCSGRARDNAPLVALMEHAPDLRAFAWLGDQIYTNEPYPSAATLNGETILAVEADNPLDQATTMAQLYAHYRAYWQQPYTARMLKHCANYFIGDDHDHNVGNDFDGSVAAANATVAWASNTTQVDAMTAWCLDAFRAYCKGNPGWPSLNFNVRVNADVELFFVNGVSYRDAADGSGTTCLGAAQKAALLAAIAASTATWKLILCGKNLYGGADDLSKYNAERAELESFFENTSSWAVPGGAIWLSGDIHYPFMSGEPGAIFDLCSSPLGTGHSTTVANGYANKQRWKVSGNVSSGVAAVAVPQAVGFVRIRGSTRLDVGLMRLDGSMLWSGHLLPGSNEVRYDRQRVA